MAERLAWSPPTTAGRVTHRFSQLGIVANDAAGRRVFSGISRFPRTFIPCDENTVCEFRALHLAVMAHLVREATRPLSHPALLGQKLERCRQAGLLITSHLRHWDSNPRSAHLKSNDLPLNHGNKTGKAMIIKPLVVSCGELEARAHGKYLPILTFPRLFELQHSASTIISWQLSSVRLIADSTCPLCGNTDTALHRIISCVYAAPIWQWCRVRVRKIIRDERGDVSDTHMLHCDFLTFPSVRRRAAAWYILHAIGFLVDHSKSVTVQDFVQLLRQDRWNMAQCRTLRDINGQALLRRTSEVKSEVIIKYDTDREPESVISHLSYRMDPSNGCSSRSDLYVEEIIVKYARVRHTHRTHSIPESQQCDDWETPLAPISSVKVPDLLSHPSVKRLASNPNHRLVTAVQGGPMQTDTPAFSCCVHHTSRSHPQSPILLNPIGRLL
ncbi:hypothetical protein PR048_032151 [Dryococelus australis]|uniref:Reverse transcriptase zinc-binding domain-containing protein n=1 Tax=Dryococelus australis TaxID=614101 RepID=A0ABQ9G4M2_9NEOP|nr:hypothetical protein PR048_032151 [Dryococelus australis]